MFEEVALQITSSRFQNHRRMEFQRSCNVRLQSLVYIIGISTNAVCMLMGNAKVMMLKSMYLGLFDFMNAYILRQNYQYQISVASDATVR